MADFQTNRTMQKWYVPDHYWENRWGSTSVNYPFGSEVAASQGVIPMVEAGVKCLAKTAILIGIGWVGHIVYTKVKK